MIGENTRGEVTLYLLIAKNTRKRRVLTTVCDNCITSRGGFERKRR